jgi:6-phosphogluconolactonase (cycloisomerase 2 family)
MQVYHINLISYLTLNSDENLLYMAQLKEEERVKSYFYDTGTVRILTVNTSTNIHS